MGKGIAIAGIWVGVGLALVGITSERYGTGLTDALTVVVSFIIAFWATRQVLGLWGKDAI